MKTTSQLRPDCVTTQYLSPDPDLGGTILQGMFGGESSPPQTGGELDDDSGSDDDAEDETDYDGENDGDDGGDGDGYDEGGGDTGDEGQTIDDADIDPAIANILAKSKGDPRVLAKSYREAEKLIGQQGRVLGELNQQNAMLQQLSAQLLAAQAAQSAAMPQIPYAPVPQQQQEQTNPDEFLSKLTEKGPEAIREVVAQEFAKAAAISQQQQALLQQQQMAEAMALQAQQQQAEYALSQQIGTNNMALSALAESDPDFKRYAPIMKQMLNLPQYQELMMIPNGVTILAQAAKGFAAQQGNRVNKNAMRVRGPGGRYVESDEGSSLENKVLNRLFPKTR